MVSVPLSRIDTTASAAAATRATTVASAPAMTTPMQPEATAATRERPMVSPPAGGDDRDPDTERDAGQGGEVVIAEERRHPAAGGSVIEVPDETDQLERADERGEAGRCNECPYRGECVFGLPDDERHRDGEHGVFRELHGAHELRGEWVPIDERRPEHGEREHDRRQRGHGNEEHETASQSLDTVRSGRRSGRGDDGNDRDIGSEIETVVDPSPTVKSGLYRSCTRRNGTASARVSASGSGP